MALKALLVLVALAALVVGLAIPTPSKAPPPVAGSFSADAG
jgi:hypothetical protein